MCSFERTSSCWPDSRPTGSDVTASCVTSSSAAAESSRLRSRRQRAVPPAWRYSLPATATVATPAARRQHVGTAGAISTSGDDSELITSGVGRRRPLQGRYTLSGSRNAASESGPRARPTCLRYSYWLTLENQLRTNHFRLNHFRWLQRGGSGDCKVNGEPAAPPLLRVATSPTSDDDDSAPLRRHLAFCHVTGNGGASDPATDCRGRDAATRAASGGGGGTGCRAVRDEPVDTSRPRGGSDVIAAGGSREPAEVEEEGGGRRRRLSLSRIGDSGLGASMHSEPGSPADDREEDLNVVDHHHRHQPQQQQQRRLSDDVDDDVTSDVTERRRRRQCQTLRQRETDDDDDDVVVACWIHVHDDVAADDRTKLTRHKRE